MDKEQKIRVAHRVMLVSAIFCGVVALLLILNFWNMKQSEPLESRTIEVLVERLKQEPDNEQLKEEIRQFDLLARKAYFTSKWQVKTGTWLLLLGGIVLAVSMKVHTDLRSRILEPEEISEDLLRSRANAQYWLFLSGGLILGLALAAGLLTRDYLARYDEQADLMARVETEGGPEVIQVFPAGDSADAAIAVEGTAGESVEIASPGEGPAEAGVDPSSGTDSGETAETAPQPAPEVPAAGSASGSGGKAFNPEDFKKNQNTFRAYMGQGVSYSRNVPMDWDGPSGKNIKWKVNLSKPGFNSPVIWGDQIYVSGGDAEARVVACYNRHTGRLLWEKKADGIEGSPASVPKTTDDTGLAAPSMAVDADGAYAMFATGDVIAFDHGGKRLWARNLVVPKKNYGQSSSLMVWDSRLVIQVDDYQAGLLTVLDTRTGKTLWEVKRAVGASWASPVLADYKGRIQILTTSDPLVMGHDLYTGEELWKYEVMMGEIGPSVAYADGLVYATQEYATTVALVPEAGNEIAWESDEYSSEVGSPVAYNGLLFLATSYGIMTCFDGKTGELVWEKELDEEIWSSPVAVEGKIYIIDKGGVTYIIKADRSGEILARPALGEVGLAIPVFADGMLYLRGNNKTLYCIEE